MKKKILSIIMAAVIAATVVPMIGVTPKTANAESIVYNPNDPQFCAGKNIIIHAEPKDLSLPVGAIVKGFPVKGYDYVTDKNNVTWVKVKVLGDVELYGYVKESDLGTIYY